MTVGQSEDTATKAPVQKAKRRKKDNLQHINNWIHLDISLPTDFRWILLDPVLETVEPPVSFYEKFLLMILWNLPVRNQSDMQSPRKNIVLPLILTRWKHLLQSFWLGVMWTCQVDQCIGNTIKIPTTQQYHHYYNQTDLMTIQILIRKTSLRRWDRSSINYMNNALQTTYQSNWSA